MPAQVILEVVSGPIQGKVFSFASHDTFLFGRHGTCHARLPNDPLVSRHNFILEANPPDVRLRDLGSLNGTFVNGVKHGGRAPDEKPEEAAKRRYPEVDLKHGDRITVGNTTIAVQVLLPAACCRCGVEISDADKPAAKLADGTFTCEGCRFYTVTVSRLRMNPAAPAPTSALVPHCERCGRDVSAEVRNGRRGSYVCESCRGGLLSRAGGRPQPMSAVEQFREIAGCDIPGYDIAAELGKGGMGAVFRATRIADQQAVAIKVMLAKVAVDEPARQMFAREIEVTRGLRQPHIVRLIENGSAGSAFYFVMEFCNRGNLHQLMQRHGGKLSWSAAVPLMLHCLAGLEHAHGQNFVHRDLKPHNVLLDESAGRCVAKISDFGLSKNFERAGLSGMTATGGFAGTYYFMPREQLTEFKYVRPTSDVWSLAATFYNALTGKYPLNFSPKRDPMEVILHDDPVPIRDREPAIPPAGAAVIDRALLVDPLKRFPTASEMRLALEYATSNRSNAI